MDAVTGRRAAMSAAMSWPLISDVAEVEPHQLAEVVEPNCTMSGSVPAERLVLRGDLLRGGPGPGHHGAGAAGHRRAPAGT